MKLNCHNGLFIYGISFVLCPARRQWVREEDLASDLKKNSKQVRKVLRHFEEEHLVTRYQRKEVFTETICAPFQIGGDVYHFIATVLFLLSQ